MITQNIVFIGPLNDKISKLKSIYEEHAAKLSADPDAKESINISLITDILEANQLIANTESHLWIASNAKKAINFGVTNKKIIKKNKHKMIVLSSKPIPMKTLQKIEQIGITVLFEPVPPKSLQYKVSLLLKSLSKRKEEKVLEQKKGEIHQEAGSKEEQEEKKKVEQHEKQQEEVDAKHLTGMIQGENEESDLSKNLKGKITQTENKEDEERTHKSLNLEIEDDTSKKKNNNSIVDIEEDKKKKDHSIGLEFDEEGGTKPGKLGQALLDEDLIDEKKSGNLDLNLEEEEENKSNPNKLEVDEEDAEKKNLDENIEASEDSKDKKANHNLDIEEEESNNEPRERADLEEEGKKENNSDLQIADEDENKKKSGNIHLAAEEETKKEKSNDIQLETDEDKEKKSSDLNIEEDVKANELAQADTEEDEEKKKKRTELSIEEDSKQGREKRALEETISEEKKANLTPLEELEEERKKKSDFDVEEDENKNKDNSQLDIFDDSSKKKRTDLDIEEMKKKKKGGDFSLDDSDDDSKKDSGLELEGMEKEKKNGNLDLEIEDDSNSDKSNSLDIIDDSENKTNNLNGLNVLDEDEKKTQNLFIDDEMNGRDFGLADREGKGNWAKMEVEKKEKKVKKEYDDNGETINYSDIKNKLKRKNQKRDIPKEDILIYDTRGIENFIELSNIYFDPEAKEFDFHTISSQLITQNFIAEICFFSFLKNEKKFDIYYIFEIEEMNLFFQGKNYQKINAENKTIQHMQKMNSQKGLFNFSKDTVKIENKFREVLKNKSDYWKDLAAPEWDDIYFNQESNILHYPLSDGQALFQVAYVEIKQKITQKEAIFIQSAIEAIKGQVIKNSILYSSLGLKDNEKNSEEPQGMFKKIFKLFS